MVVASKFMEKANILFSPYGISVVEGSRVLGGFVGNQSETYEWGKNKEENFFAMSPDEFRDALALRYLLTPKNLPNICDGCGEEFNLCHALNCKKGGLVSARHNEMRDLNCDLCSLAGMTQIISEPLIQEGNDKS